MTLRSFGDEKIERARFMVELRSLNQTAGDPIAFDLHPEAIYSERKGRVKLEISPSFKFVEIEASVGNAHVEIEYDKLIPVVTGGGALESAFDWDLRSAPDVPLQGVRWFHSIIKVPENAQPIEVRLAAGVDVRRAGGLFRGMVRGEEHSALNYQLDLE
jgi:hypothetical protein